MLKFTKDHEWVFVVDNVATIGITSYAAEQLGDIVYVELPELGTEAKKGEGFAVVESVKAASDVYSPVTGQVIDANSELAESPELVNHDPQNKGWFAKIQMENPSELDELMNEEEYKALIGQ